MILQFHIANLFSSGQNLMQEPCRRAVDTGNVAIIASGFILKVGVVAGLGGVFFGTSSSDSHLLGLIHVNNPIFHQFCSRAHQ